MTASNAVVLGAGGPFAWLFHLGVLDGLEELGLPLSSARRVVATSAGAAVAASRLAGTTTTEFLRAIGTTVPPRRRKQLIDALRVVRSDPIGTLRPGAPHLLTGSAGESLLFGAGLLPRGAFDPEVLSSFLPSVPDGWPASLWFPAVRVDDGSTVVFGRDRSDVPVRAALEASCAVPGWFRSKMIGGEAFMDGAIASPTHANLLANEESDFVVISSPMTRDGHTPPRRAARKRLEMELRSLARPGREMVVISPNREVREIAYGYPYRTRSRVDEIVTAAREQVRGLSGDGMPLSWTADRKRSGTLHRPPDRSC